MTTTMMMYGGIIISAILALYLLPLWLYKSKNNTKKPFITIGKSSYAILFWIILNIIIFLYNYIDLMDIKSIIESKNQQILENMNQTTLNTISTDNTLVSYGLWFLMTISIQYLGWVYGLLYYPIFNKMYTRYYKNKK